MSERCRGLGSRAAAPRRGGRRLGIARCRQRPRLEDRQPGLEPGGRQPALACAAEHIHRGRGSSLSQSPLRRDRTGERTDQLVRAAPQGGLGQLQLGM